MTGRTQAPGAGALRRDGVTWLVYLQIGIYGWVLYSMGPAIQLLREETGVSKTVSGLHGTAMAVGALVTGIVGARVVARIGRHGSIWVGIVGSCVGAVLMTASTALWVTLLGAFFTTFFGSYIVNSVSTVMADHHRGPNASAAVSEAHGMAAAVGLVAPLAIGVAQGTGIGWRAGLLVVLGLTALLWMTMRDVRIPDHRREVVAHVVDARRLPRAYWWSWSALVACVAVEFCVSIWSSVLLRERVGLSKSVAATGVTALVAGMAVGRFAAGRLARRVDSARLMYMALVVAAAGWALLWSATSAVPAYLGLVVCGLGIAFHFPVGVMRALAVAPGAYDRAAARASIGTGIAIGLGPFVLGALADRLSTHTAFLAVPVLLAVATVAVWRSVYAPTWDGADPGAAPATIDG